MATTLEELYRRALGNAGLGISASANQIGTRQTPRTLSPTATNTDQSAAARVNRALAIMDSTNTAQRSRTAAESQINPEVSDLVSDAASQRRRIMARLNAPGSMNPVQARFLLRQLDSNQQALNAGLSAAGDVRNAQVTRANTLTQRDAALTDRAMSEAGAYDRALLNYDVAGLQGAFGLARQQLANEGAVAARTTLDPLRANALRLMRQAENQVASRGTPAEQLQFGLSAIDASLGLGGMGGLAASEPLVEVETIDAQGKPITLQLPRSEAAQVSRYAAIMANPQAYGLTPDLVAKYAAQLASGQMTPQDVILVEQQSR